MDIFKINELHKNPINNEIRQITRKAKNIMDEDILLGQISPFLIELPSKMILGGNNHYDSYLERGIETVKCITVEFTEEPEGIMATVDGEPQRSRFYKSIEEARLIYARAHNGQYATDNVEGLINYAQSLHINIDEVRVNVQEPITITELLDKEERQEEMKKYFIKIKCNNEIEQKEIAEKLTGLNVSYKFASK